MRVKTRLDIQREFSFGIKSSVMIAVVACMLAATGTLALASDVRSTRPPVIIIPAFAGSRLIAWKSVDCVGPLGFAVGEPVWLDASKVFGATTCWLHCMQLDPLTQADPLDCKLRVDEGLEAIEELDPGFITGYISALWRTFVTEAAQFGYDPHDMVGMPYDFRVAPHMLEERDGYFTRLRNALEMARRDWLRRNAGVPFDGAVVLAHSMGNSVFRYFLEWVELDLGKLHAERWIDQHIGTYFNVGGGIAGATESLKSLITGLPFGLPITELQARKMTTTFGSGPWMLPFATDIGDVLSFPAAVVNITWSDGEEPAVTHYAAEDIASGKLLQDMGTRGGDPIARRSYKMIQAYYWNNLHGHAPLGGLWERPPIKRVYCVYGVNLKTTLALHYLHVPPSHDKASTAWRLKDIHYETGKGGDIGGRKSGDGSVPYASLAHCHNWFSEPVVNITRIPQRARYTTDEVEVLLNVDRSTYDLHLNSHAAPASGWYTTLYEEHSYSCDGALRDTSVWEMEGVQHRAILGESHFVSEVLTDLMFQTERTLQRSSHCGGPAPTNSHAPLSFHKRMAAMTRALQADEDDKAGLCGNDFGLPSCPAAKTEAKIEKKKAQQPIPSDNGHFVSRLQRVPQADDDCYWDYYNVRCAMADHCVYQYKFGDIHLSQSCRLRTKREEEMGEADAAKPCRCKEWVGQEPVCVGGFCHYDGPCAHATQPFGRSHGWWGPCVHVSLESPSTLHPADYQDKAEL